MESNYDLLWLLADYLQTLFHCWIFVIIQINMNFLTRKEMPYDVLIVYYSMYGHIPRMAEAVKEGPMA